jgi:hypothetical protein
MILSAFGIPDYSPLQVSELLKYLSMSHTLEGGYVRHLTCTVDGLCKEQPVWPIVVDRIKAIPRIRTTTDRQVLFVCDSRAALSQTNLGTELWPEHRGIETLRTLKKVLVQSNKSKGWTLTTSEPTTLEYVESASKPSYLNLIQTLLYKLTPYALRKEVQHLVISYLAGTASYTALNKKLRSSLKLQDLSVLLNDPKAKELRAAVSLLSSMSVEEVAKTTGFQTFEILYISRSNDKNKV